MLQRFFPSTLKQIAILYGLLTGLCLISIWFFDRPIADAMHAQHFESTVLRLFSHTPVLLEFAAGLIIFACVHHTVRQRYLPLATDLVFSLIIAFSLRLAAKAAFGRTWPESWITLPSGQNPSWVVDRVEEFHPFAEGLAFNSFPSGHALLTFALALTFWRHLPRLAPIWLMLMSAAMIGQLSLNYHFLGDLLAGASLGLAASHIAKCIQQNIVPNIQPKRGAG